LLHSLIDGVGANESIRPHTLLSTFSRLVFIEMQVVSIHKTNNQSVFHSVEKASIIS